MQFILCISFYASQPMSFILFISFQAFHSMQIIQQIPKYAFWAIHFDTYILLDTFQPKHSNIYCGYQTLNLGIDVAISEAAAYCTGGLVLSKGTRASCIKWFITFIQVFWNTEEKLGKLEKYPFPFPFNVLSTQNTISDYVFPVH